MDLAQGARLRWLDGVAGGAGPRLPLAPMPCCGDPTAHEYLTGF